MYEALGSIPQERGTERERKRERDRMTIFKIRGRIS
jgi:hypothetical protein